MAKIKKIGVFYNAKKKHVKEFLGDFEKFAKRKKIVYEIFDDQPLSIPKIDAAVALGGDGTILQLGRYLAGSNIPIIGVNMGRLGFLAETGREDLWNELEHILSKSKVDVENRALLEVKVKRNSKIFQRYLAVNDVVIRNGERARVIDLDVCVDEELVARYTGDGVIISTPTGSTAYSLASGGPIVYPTLPLTIISAICPHTLALRPVIVGSDKVVTVKPKDSGSDVILSVDGQISQKVFEGDEVIIKKSNKKIGLVLSQKYSYFEVLRKKLGWGNR